MEFSAITFEVRDQLAHITLNRPDSANALNLELARDLMHASLRCDEDPEIGAVLLSGAGKRFCGGGDLKSFLQHEESLSAHLKETTTYLHAAISRFTRMEAPLVVAAHGAAAGAGLSLACCGDLVLAGESARFTMAYTRVGLTPDGSSTYFLPRIVGLKRALELALTNRVLSAQEAHEWGIVTRVVPDADLLAEARQLATQLAHGPRKALGAAKRLFHIGWSETLETQMENETQAIAQISLTADAREGMTAFVQKREPRFRSD